MDGPLPPPLAAAAATAFDDVDEYPWVDDGMGMDQFSQVFDLVQQGNRAFRENRIDLAIGRFSKAHLIKPGDAIVLGNRCAAFCRKSNALKSRSASASEYRPLNGLDPTSYAELALKDAERISGRHPNILKSYYLKANAQILLERYDEARETLLNGLHLDTLCVPLQDLLRGVERISPGRCGNTRPRRLVRTDDFECTLCFKLLHQPVTTPCGHSFCRTCIFQTMDHGNKCPMCRTVLFISLRTCAVRLSCTY